jgi:hypothetical protein
MDGATIGPNTVLQQGFVGANARIGANCNLKDCQVGPGVSVPAGTRLLESYQMGTYVRTHYHKFPLDRVSLQTRTAYLVTTESQ